MRQLTSKKYWGRGYTKQGMNKAADFIATEFKSLGVLPLQTNGYHQKFLLPVNTFPGEMQVKINRTALKPGKDFLIHPASIGMYATDSLLQKDSVTYVGKHSKVVLSLRPKLTWSVSQKTLDYTWIEVRENVLKKNPSVLHANIDNKFIENFEASNVCGIIKGTAQPDSAIVFTAHYDHLGGMGPKTYFPGANDNASGVALLLNLAKHYIAHPPKYSMVFICFAAEEAGLIGSRYFTENPLFPLKNIRFLWNLDLVGTGEIGATVVNATVHPQEFALLNKLNDKNKWLPKINARGTAANSDHYFFSEKGVPAFFIYTQGGITAYHDIYDKAKTLPLTAYEGLFKLISKFNQEIK